MRTYLRAAMVFLGYTEDAVKSLTKAVDILQITHGTNTPFMKDLLFKLEEAHAEASFKLSSKDEERDIPYRHN
ncbi:unnamed protein product [Ilex paraguariensis]|uniref:Uncharacterized protein n=1 Tax=Ilex paraguariensis TaxID=185542 RepID=A0ABC8U2U8_9AQUA